MVTQECKQCHIEKEIELFRKVTNQYTGVHPMSICKDCYKSNQDAQKKQEAQERERLKAKEEERKQKQLEQEGLAHLYQAFAKIGSGLSVPGGWCYALEQRLSEGTIRSGKWLLWPEGQEALTVWETICKLTQDCQLGTQAKIWSGRKIEGEHVICVYTPDSDDLPDLQRVVNQLRENLDPKYRLIYKENRMTQAGYYSERHAGARKDKKNYVERPVSKWYVRPYERTVNAVKGYIPPEAGETDNE